MKKLTEIVLASNNNGKLNEFSQLFADFNVTIRPQKEWQLSDAVEDGLSFVENAIIKARHASKATNLPAVADDSGIEVFALNGKPGIYSARYAGDNASDKDNIDLLLNNLHANELQRGARFYCALALVRHCDDPTPVIAEGSWYGEIANSPSGEHGFGYDPVFYVPEKDCTAAELSKEQKSQISHRAQATQVLVARLKNLQLI